CYESPLQRRLCLGDIGAARAHRICQRPKAVHRRGRHRAFLRGNHDFGGGWPGLIQESACGSAEPHVTPLECAAISDFGKTLLGLLCGLAAAAIWGGGSAVLRHLVTSGLGPADLTLLRYVGCFPVALVALFLMGDRICIGVAWRHLAVLLILGGPLYHAIVVAGYQYTSAGGGALLMSGLLPVFAIGLHWIVTSTTPPRTKVIGTIAVLAGLVWFGLGAGSILSPAGVVLFAIAAAAWAVLNELVRRWQVDPL